MLIALTPNVDPRAIELLRRFNDVEIALNAPQSVVVTESDVLPVNVEFLDAEQIPIRITQKSGRVSLVIANAVLDGEAAARLEDAGISYFDAGGHRWLPHLKRTERRRRPRSSGQKRGLYAASIRLGQLLADHPSESWTERGLARRGLTTQATAHRFLARLEREGFLEREGRGRNTSRWVREPSRMRAWLAQEARPQRVTQLSCFVRDPFRLPEIVGRAFALTGAVAAEEVGVPVLTGPALPTLRVNVAADELENIPEALGGFRTDDGANLTLVADPDRLAFIDARNLAGGRLVAPPSRIMLDLHLEGRGDAAVGVFLDLWGDREIFP